MGCILDRTVRLAFALALVAAVATPAPAEAMDDAALHATVSKRLVGDRTGACFAAAVITEEDVNTAYVCADGKPATRVDEKTAFEIGSVSKTMTAALLASLIEEGKTSLDAPLASLLPEGAEVPSFEGEPILLRHLVTHTSGLPALPVIPIANPNDPYAAMDPETVLGALAETPLTEAPGNKRAYSNFASMVLSHGVGLLAGKDFEALAKERIFDPLGMKGAYVTKAPEGIRPAAGHRSSGRETIPWNFHPSLAGVGGVRATLDDMVRYVQGQLGLVDAPIRSALERTHARIEGTRMGMNWMIAASLGGEFLAHEGGTGGFSSFVAFDPKKKRGVVVLSDTAMTHLGGLGDVGLHLMDPKMPLGMPRKVAKPPAETLDGLEGAYLLDGGLEMKLAKKGDKLTIHPKGQPVFEMGYDSAGTFYPLLFDAVLRPMKGPDGIYRFTWSQGGATVIARPVAASSHPPRLVVPKEVLAGYVGEYPLMPAFSLRVTADDDELFIQGTGQPAIAVEATKEDVFVSPAGAAEIHFERGEDGEVNALVLHQHGAKLRGERRPLSE